MVNNAQDKKYGTEHLLVFTPVYASYFIVGLLCYVYVYFTSLTVHHAAFKPSH